LPHFQHLESRGRQHARLQRPHLDLSKSTQPLSFCPFLSMALSSHCPRVDTIAYSFTSSTYALAFLIDPPCPHNLREAGLPLQFSTQNHTQGVQSTNQMPIDDSREKAVPQRQDKYFVRSRSLLECLSRPVSAMTMPQMVALSRQRPLFRLISSFGFWFQVAICNRQQWHRSYSFPPGLNPSPPAFPASLSGARTHLFSSRPSAPTMTFFPLLTSLPVSLLLNSSGARVLPSSARARLRRLLLCPSLVWRP